MTRGWTGQVRRFAFRCAMLFSLVTALVVALVVTSAFLLVLRPEWVFHESSFRWGLPLLRKRGIEVDWRALRFELISHSAWDKEVFLVVLEPHYFNRKTAVRFSGREIEARVRVLFSPRNLLRGKWRRGIREWRAGYLKAKAISAPEGWSGSMELQQRSGAPWEFELTTEVRRQQLSLDVRSRIIRRAPGHWQVEPSGKIREKDWVLRLRQGCLLAAVADSGDHAGAPTPPTLKIDCPLDFRIGANFQQLLFMRVREALPGLAPDQRIPVSWGGRLRSEWRVAAGGPPASKASGGRWFKSGWEGSIALLGQPLLLDWLSARDFIFRAQARVVPADFPQNFDFQSTLQMVLKISDFARAVRVFRQTDFAVPAPVNALQGQVTLQLSGKWSAPRLEFPFFLKTSLTGAEQWFETTSRGHLGWQQLTPSGASARELQGGLAPWRGNLQADVSLDRVVLALPRLNLEKPPRLFPDTRISIEAPSSSSAAPPQAESDFGLDLRIRSHPSQPVLLLSHLAPVPIPAEVDLRISHEDPVRGFVQLGQFPLRLFRRDVRLERLRFELDPHQEDFGESAGRLEGALRVKYTDYTVQMRAQGPLERPVLRIWSDPPLPESQLYSVLLFGRRLEELEADQGTSVGNVRSAVADGALGFASLYLLAATPVESVGYDATSGIFTAKIRLGEGTSLNLGGRPTAEGAVQRIGVRRRLSRHWTLMTDFSTASDTAAGGPGSAIGGLSAFLEWLNRY